MTQGGHPGPKKAQSLSDRQRGQTTPEQVLGVTGQKRGDCVGALKCADRLFQRLS